MRYDWGMRPRRYLPAWLFALLRPFFRYSQTRHAYVLRLVGRRMGPVIRKAGTEEPAPVAPVEPLPPKERTGRFARERDRVKR